MECAVGSCCPEAAALLEASARQLAERGSAAEEDVGLLASLAVSVSEVAIDLVHQDAGEQTGTALQLVYCLGGLLQGLQPPPVQQETMPKALSEPDAEPGFAVEQAVTPSKEEAEGAASSASAVTQEVEGDHDQPDSPCARKEEYEGESEDSSSSGGYLTAREESSYSDIAAGIRSDSEPSVHTLDASNKGPQLREEEGIRTEEVEPEGAAIASEPEPEPDHEAGGSASGAEEQTESQKDDGSDWGEEEFTGAAMEPAAAAEVGHVEGHENGHTPAGPVQSLPSEELLQAQERCLQVIV